MKSRDFLLISIPIISAGTNSAATTASTKNCEHIFLENAISEKIEKLFSQKTLDMTDAEATPRRTERLKFREAWNLHLASKQERIIPSGDGLSAIRVEPNGNINIIDLETSNDYPLMLNNFFTKAKDIEISAFKKFGGRVLITQQNSEGHFVHSWIQVQTYMPSLKTASQLIWKTPLTERGQVGHGSEPVLSLLSQETSTKELESLMVFDHANKKIVSELKNEKVNVTFDIQFHSKYVAFINEKFELVLWDHVNNQILWKVPTGIHPQSIPNMDTRVNINLEYQWVNDAESLAIANENRFELRETKTGRILKHLQFESELVNLFASEVSDHYGFQLQDTLLIYRHASNQAPLTISIRPLVRAAVDLFETTDVVFLSPKTVVLQSPSYRLFFDLQSGLNITHQYSQLPVDLFFASEGVAHSIKNLNYQIWIRD